MKKLWNRLTWNFRRIRVFALVGRSGTGKSFRARLVMEKFNIELMIDDGLLIRDQKIIAGRSAKREKAYFTGVKTALFNDKNHRRQVLDALERESFKRILIIGTSERMVNKIADTLRLPQPHKVISIEEIATSEEINTAIQYRKLQGRHVIPVPSIEVRNNYPKVMADSIKIFLRQGFGMFRRQEVYEKTVIRPEFSRKGSITIAKNALSQMVLHCVDEYSPGLSIRKVSVKNEPRGYKIDVYLEVPFGLQLSGAVHDLQNYIIDSIEKFTGIIIEELNVVVDTVSDKKLEKKGEKRADKREKRAEKKAQ